MKTLRQVLHLRALTGLLALVVCLPAAAQNVVIDWNGIAVQTVTVNAKKPACAAGIYLAIVHLAVYDAVNSIDGRFQPYAISINAPASASKEAAVATAAYRVLVTLFPSQQAFLDSSYAASLSSIPDGAPKTDGIAVGEQAAQSILALRANDGREANIPYVPGSGPGIWQPTPPAFLAAQTPWVGETQPFTMTRPSQFLPASGPPSLDSQEWADDYNQVRILGAKIGSSRTPEQTEIGLFWTENPAVQTNRAYRALAAQQGLGTADSARMFAMVSAAAADSCIGCLNSKYRFNFWRPVTAIPAGDTDGNPATIADPAWEP